MPRKGPAPKRPLVVDPVHNSPLVTQLVNKILLDEGLNLTGVGRVLELEQDNARLRESNAELRAARDAAASTRHRVRVRGVAPQVRGR